MASGILIYYENHVWIAIKSLEQQKNRRPKQVCFDRLFQFTDTDWDINGTGDRVVKLFDSTANHSQA